MAVDGDGARGAQEEGEPEASQGFTFADLFAGVGGIRRGFESVGGRCVFTSEWNPHAQKTYRANFDDAHEIAGDITKVKAADIPDHDVLVGGFPCFAKGTLVHALEGLRPIEEIRAGDWVLGCSGEYRRVSAAMMKDGAPTRKLELDGGPGLTTTDEHPFWARSASGEPSWVEAKDLDESMWVGLPIDRAMARGGRRSEAFWRLAGLWLRSGAVEGVAGRGPRATLGWTKRADLATRRLLNRSKALRRPVQGTRAELRGMVEEFWSPVEGKRLPGHVHHLPARFQKALWEGWMSGEGEASKALKLGMERAKRNALGQGSDFVWARVSSNKPTGVCETVHNIAVDEDESYVVEGALVHNCQPFSIAGVSKKASMGRAHGFEDKTQGTLFFDVARIIKAKRPKAFLLENVKNLLSHDKGRTFQVIRETLEEELGYHVQWKVVDSSPWVPQRRERLLIVGFRRDAGFDFKDLAPPAIGPKLGAILHPQDGSEAACPFTEGPLGTPLSKYTVTDGLWAYLQAYAAKHKAAGNGFGFGLVDEKSVARTLSARYYKDGSEILVSQGPGKNPRRLTPRECARLMGFPESQKIPVSDSQAYKQFGNSVAVPAIAAVARLMAPCVERLIQEEAAGVPWPKVRRRRAKPEASSKKAKGAGQEG